MQRNLTWKPRAAGLGIWAEGADHAYYVYRMGRRWDVKIAPVTVTKGARTVSRSRVLFDKHHDTRALAQAVAEAFEEASPLERRARWSG